jgi:tetratricopeptide (TPR) repeat protein
LNPALPNVDSLLAMSLSEIGRHDEALPALEKAFHQQSTDSALRRMAGLHLQRSYTDLGRDSNAVAVALELSRLYPDDPEVLYHTGRLFGNYAYLQMVRLARIAPDSVWLHQAAGEANESQGLLDEAIKEYQQVLAMSRNDRPSLRIGRRSWRVRFRRRATPRRRRRRWCSRELQIDPSAPMLRMKSESSVSPANSTRPSAPSGC